MPTTPKRHKSFGKKAPDSSAPLTFDLYDETFEAYPDMQGAVLLEILADLSDSSGEDGNGAAAAATLVTFFDAALKPESLKRFKDLTHDPERIVTADTLSEIVAWLMEEYTDRPTSDSSQ